MQQIDPRSGGQTMPDHAIPAIPASVNTVPIAPKAATGATSASTSGNPINSDNPAYPNNPANSAHSSKPSNSANPANPDNPGIATNPGSLTIPARPNNPVKQISPTSPADPDSPFNTGVTRKGLPPALWALTISAFAIGTTEFVAVGILPTVAHSLSVSVSTAGLLVSIYALGVALGGPFLTALTGNLPRKPLMISLMGLFVLGHLASAAASSFTMLLIARFISGFAHAVFFGVGATIAASVVAPDKKATAIALMFAGLTVAIIAGVPLGTFIGQHFGWRSTFLGVALLGLIGMAAIAILLPRQIQSGPALKLKDQLAVLKSGPILLVLGVTAFGYGGIFVPFTYLATILEKVTGFDPSLVSLLLLIYGIAIALGNVIGGRLSNHNPSAVLLRLFLLLALVLVAFTFTMHSRIGSIITLLLMGGLSFATVPGLQLYIVQLAEQWLPGTEGIASSLNISAFNLGAAIGSWVGGIAVAQPSLGLANTPWIGALIILLGSVLMVRSTRLGRNKPGPLTSPVADQ